MRLAALLGIAFSLVQSIAVAAGHDFCVTRVWPAGSDSIRTRLLGDAHAPSREVMGQLLVRHYRQSPVTTIRVEDYHPDSCAASDSQFLMLNGTAPWDTPAPRSPALPESGGGANLAAKLITNTYMDLTMQAISAVGSANGAAHQIICGMVKC